MDDILPPSADVLAAVMAEHESRYPEKFTLTVIGDGGKRVRLPVVLANPSGAYEPQPGVRQSGAWGALLASVMRLVPEPSNLADMIAQDCVAWPARGVLSQWCQRWPGLAKSIADIVGVKVGANATAIVEPVEDEMPPTNIAAVLAQHPHAVWRRVRPRADVDFGIVLDTPSSAAWRLYNEAVKKKGADAWKLSRDITVACLVGCTEDTETTLRRWPGLVPVYTGEIAELAGMSANFEMGF